MIKKRVDKRAKELYDEFIKNNINVVAATSFVNFFGKESLGVKQIRGMGNLLMTDSELHFEMWKPRRELKISLNSITSVEITKWHLNKTKGSPLLKVIFTNEKGQRDSVAWSLRNLEEWKGLLDQIIAKKI